MSILNTMLDEAASRKKKQSDMIMDDSDVAQSDAFMESADFNKLFERLMQRAATLLKSDIDLSRLLK